MSGDAGPQVKALSGGRVHLSHGPIDLIIGVEPASAQEAAFAAACARLATVLSELVPELPRLRQPRGLRPKGAIARAMQAAVAPHAPVFVTPMAAVAGAVADAVLAAMTAAAPLSRAYINNGGDIALHLGAGEQFSVAVSSLAGAPLARLNLSATDAPRGIATSGFGGRSQTMGIADAVTVLAATAARADAAATLVANAVDLPGHPAIRRVPACTLRCDSDLGVMPVTTALGHLAPHDVALALASGAAVARGMLARGLIDGAALFLRGQSCTVGTAPLTPAPFQAERIAENA